MAVRPDGRVMQIVSAQLATDDGLSKGGLEDSFISMDAETSPRSFSSHLYAALTACRGAWSHAAQLPLDIALPTLCASCRDPVDGEGVCAECWAKLSFIAPPYC